MVLDRRQSNPAGFFSLFLASICIHANSELFELQSKFIASCLVVMQRGRRAEGRRGDVACLPFSK